MSQIDEKKKQRTQRIPLDNSGTPGLGFSICGAVGVSLAIVAEGEVAFVGHVLPLAWARVGVARVWGRNHMSLNVSLH